MSEIPLYKENCCVCWLVWTNAKSGLRLGEPRRQLHGFMTSYWPAEVTGHGHSLANMSGFARFLVLWWWRGGTFYVSKRNNFCNSQEATLERENSSVTSSFFMFITCSFYVEPEVNTVCLISNILCPTGPSNIHFVESGKDGG